MKRKMNKKWVSLGMAGFVLMGSVFAGNATPISAHKNKETTNTEQQPSDKQNMPTEDSQNQTPDDNKNDNHFYNVITGSAINGNWQNPLDDLISFIDSVTKNQTDNDNRFNHIVSGPALIFDRPSNDNIGNDNASDNNNRPDRDNRFNHIVSGPSIIVAQPE